MGTLQIRIQFVRQWSDPTLEQTNKVIIMIEFKDYPVINLCKNVLSLIFWFLFEPRTNQLEGEQKKSAQTFLSLETLS